MGGDFRVSTGQGVDPKYAPRNVKLVAKKSPGRVVGTIAIRPKGQALDAFNGHELLWTVDNSRKDYTTVVKQLCTKGSLGKYEQQLFDSCFKKWGEEA